MKKHKLLEKAMRDYPKGTNSIGCTGKEFESTGIFKFNCNDVINVPCGLIWDAETDKWSEALTKKPKAIEVKLFKGKTANIHPNLIRIFDGNSTMNISPSDLEDMLHAYKQLNK